MANLSSDAEYRFGVGSNSDTNMGRPDKNQVGLTDSINGGQWQLLLPSGEKRERRDSNHGILRPKKLKLAKGGTGR